VTNNRCAWAIPNTFKQSGLWFKSEAGKKDEVVGVIYEPTDDITPTDKKFLEMGNSKKFHEISEIGNLGKTLSTFEGSWLETLSFDGELKWDMNRDVPYRFTPTMEGVIPSDSRFRDDMIWLLRGYEGIAH